MKASRAGIIISVMPSLIMLGLFYSLAVHMYQRFGGWPTSAGEHGFPPMLVAHGAVAVAFCTGHGLFTAFGLPVAALVCLIVPKWRVAVPYFILAALMFFIGLGLMKLAPHQFLRWWG